MKVPIGTFKSIFIQRVNALLVRKRMDFNALRKFLTYHPWQRLLPRKGLNYPRHQQVAKRCIDLSKL